MPGPVLLFPQSLIHVSSANLSDFGDSKTPYAIVRTRNSSVGRLWVMTGGGPGTNSSTLPILAYQEAFKFSQLGFGTAIATILLVVGAVFSIIYIRALKPEVD